jgi:trehalose 2-sulfotransferase
MSGAAPRLAYVLCGTPRSGSNWVCELLASTGQLGQPADYYNGAGFRARGFPDYPLAPAAQAAEALARGTGANGVVGLKMFIARAEALCGFAWAARLPAPRWVHLRRRDLLGQAISQVRADQSGRYRSTAAQRGPARYDRAALEAALHRIAAQDARWQVHFARLGVAALELYYEDVLAEPHAAVQRVADWIGLQEQVRADPARVTLAVQRDAESEAWRERFRTGLAADPSWPVPLRHERLRRLLRRAVRLLRR